MGDSTEVLTEEKLEDSTGETVRVCTEESLEYLIEGAKDSVDVRLKASNEEISGDSKDETRDSTEEFMK